MTNGLSLHITGIVQGVGFRPFVYNLAQRHQLTGWVRNTSAGVDIEVDGENGQLREFVEQLKTELPPLARLDSISVTERPASGFEQFEILHSEAIEGAFQPISPDVSICPDCRREMNDPHDRRYRYPFINCTNCGPRFTIIQDIPYDRPKTTMSVFEMCPECRAEYEDPANRRFHAQPVACPQCGPKIWLEEFPLGQGGKRTVLINVGEDGLQRARKWLAQGKILAVKGLGGFHLACDATNPTAVAELRRRKLRVGSGTKNRDLAEKFIDFMLDAPFQEDMPLNMFVYPVNASAQLPEAFAKYAATATDPASVPANLDANRNAWIQAWTDAILR